jgi:hypothetical protein
MARRNDVQALRAFLDIRSAQTLAADAQFVEAQRSMTMMQQELDVAYERQATESEAWTASLAHSTIDLQLSLAWSSALMACDAAVAVAAELARQARVVQESARTQSRLAQTRYEMAEAQEKDARRRWRRRREEISISAVEDRFSSHWAGR